ncbi:SDR family NAD(P)-dependent oxidoreductase [Paraburkholderia megapolitana]|uniref:SDR family NAD(P)-dependent oxidoreductase n=1 Tax=Paraburkholderia megapolitana TaxID=420953 RepID=UPI0038BA40B2
MPKSSNVQHQVSAPIAVIGMATVLPKARNLGEYWSHILGGTECLEPVPPSRWRIDQYHDADPSAPDKTYADRGGFMPDLAFDPLLYGIPPNSLDATDSAQLYAMMVAREALLDAGYATESNAAGKPLPAARAGVVLGVAGTTVELALDMARRSDIPKWQDALKQAGVAAEQIDAVATAMGNYYPQWTEDTFPGMLANIVAGRVANRFGLGGASHTVDAACASSLAAVRLACQELRSGAADLMISGGVDTDNSQLAFLSFSKTPALSKSGKVSAFDAEADGTLISEGVAMLVLKRLADAEADGDRIYGVIRGAGASTDAAGGAIYAPRSEGQLRALRNAYDEAGFPANSVGLIEAHATGTTVGDAVEIASLQTVLEGAKAPVALGSVKSQIGHTKAAAGAASLVKTLLALHHKVVPPTLNVRKPNTLLGEEGPLYLPKQARPWIGNSDHPRRAGVSAFGFGGANVHLALEEYAATVPANPGHRRALPLLLSAATPAALARLCEEVAARFEQDADHTQPWPDTAPPVDHPRVGITAVNAHEAATLLHLAAKTLSQRGEEAAWSAQQTVHYRRRALDGDAKVVAVFSGQGAQTVGMGAKLTTDFPQLRTIFDAFDAEAKAHGHTPITDLLYPPESFAPAQALAQRQALTHTLYAQASIGAYNMAVFTLLREHGFRPDLAIGHSFGELSALWAAGSLDDEQYRAIVLARGGALTPPAGLAEGGLLALNVDAERVCSLLPQLPGISLANLNSPRQTVAGGDAQAIEQALPVLKQAGIQAVRIPVAAAFHTAHVGYAEAAWNDALATLEPHAPHCPVLANVTAAPYPADPAGIRDLLRRQPFNAVRFREQIEAAYADGGRVFVEVGPRSILTRLVGEILEGQPHVALPTAPDPAGDDGLQIQSAAVQLAVLGLPLQLEFPAIEKAAPRALAFNISASNHRIGKRPAWPEVAEVPVAVSVSVPVTVQSPAAAVAPAPLPVAATQSIGQDVQANAWLTDVHRQFLDGQLELALTLAKHAPSAAVLQQIERGQQQAMALHLQFLQGQQALSAEIGGTAVAWSGNVGAPVAAPQLSPIAPIAFEAPRANVLAPVVAARVAAPVAAPAPVVAKTSAPVVAAPVAAASQGVDITALLLRIAAEKTGFPAEMLNAGMRLEADLGVDSIKRVEILASVRDALGVAEDGKLGDELRQAATIGDIAALLGSHQGASAAPSVASVASVASVTPVAAQASAATGIDVAALLLRIVAEKTGFPAEMLNTGMRLEADLGVDSIKRVEILAGVRDALGVAEDGKLGDELRQAATIGDIAALLGNQQSAAAPSIAPAVAAPVSASAGIDVSALLLRTVAEKTGFPAEMLNESMRLEADLGVDSIKRVEILAGVRDALGVADDGKLGDELRQAATIGDIAALLQGHVQAPATVASASGSVQTTAAASVAPLAPATTDSIDVGALLLRIIAEKTGFPAEMLNTGMRLEADLGVDSIKRVEILAGVRDALGIADSASAGDELRNAGTIAEIAALLTGMTNAVAAPTASAVNTPPAATPTYDAQRWRSLAVRAVPISLGRPVRMIADAGVLLIDDGGPLTREVAARLRQQGQRPIVLALAGWTDGVSEHADVSCELAGLDDALAALANAHGNPQSVLLLLPAGDDAASRRRLALGLLIVRAVLRWQPHCILGSARLDGRLGFDGGGDSVAGGLAGLLKTLRHEHPQSVARFVDLAGSLAPADAAEHLLSEWHDCQRAAGSHSDPLAHYPAECGWNAQGRWTLACTEENETAAETLPSLQAGDLVLVTGGARGITAACIEALAAQVPAHFVLLGRTVLTAGDPAWAVGHAAGAALKAQALEHLRSSGKQLTPRLIDEACRAVLAAREVRANLDAIRTHGAKVDYLALDLGDAAATRDALAGLIDAHGPVKMLVHGAGVLADRRIVDKTAQDIEQVFAPKLDALLTLLDALDTQPPQRVLLFSSTAGYTGNAGQSDYAMANEALSKLAFRLGRRWPQTRAVSLAWGPWDAGMVDETLKKLFADRGIGLLPLAAGTRTFVEAALSKRGGGNQYVVGATLPAPGAQAGSRVRLERSFSPQQDPLIDEHRINRLAVLPSAWVAEWLVECATRWQDRVVTALEDYRVFKGVVFDTPAPVTLTLELEVSGPHTLRASVTDADGRPRFAGNLCFDQSLETRQRKLPVATDNVADPAGYLAGPIQYGPSFRGVERVLQLDAHSTLIECRIPAHVSENTTSHGLRPLIYDIASHACLVWLMERHRAACLPASMGRFSWRGDAPMPRDFFVEMRVRSLVGPQFSCDFELCDRDGRVFALLEDFAATVVGEDDPLWNRDLNDDVIGMETA